MPRIKVYVEQHAIVPHLAWFCTGNNCSCDVHDDAYTVDEACNAGRAHLAEHHAPTVGTYCRAHGCHRFECGCVGHVIQADAERLLRVDMAPDYPNAALARLSGHTEASRGLFGDDFPCCATNQAHNTSREDV